MDLPICRTCGVQQGSPSVPALCPICADERQYVGWSGQQWTSLAELRDAGSRVELRQEAPGLWGVGTNPSFAIGQRALLVPGPGGNLLWDCVSYVDDDGVAAISALGGVSAIAVSHPHFYGAMVSWSEAFGGVPIYVHAADSSWIQRRGNIVLWSGDTVAPLPDRTLVNCGVHFAGGTVLHWPGALASGDIFMVVSDRRWVSFMYSYPNLIPEHPDTISRAVALVEPFDFTTIYGAWWDRVVTTDAKAALRRSAARYRRHLGLG